LVTPGRILRCIYGDQKMTQQEFEHIYISIKGNLMGLARQFCRSASIDLDAEDVVQEALIAFWELAERDYPMPNPKALLVLITKNICISRYRKRKIETEPISRDDFLGGESASRTIEMADEQIIKQRLYDTLTKTERLYMLMKTEQGMSLDEMVQETGGTRASIKVALSKAKKKIEKQLKRMGYGK